ncbi:hypothetical protein [Pedobacter sp.]|jgi:hypothetical protein|uniref:hypothetical protein n=1 Tax=Pedobacter sp. TaxID=1411316 RepID=UPI002CA437E7|nr:hypothetical protein [Pedobacter sp.]HWW42662.1 hypothetical protein [Pedobacter sp.]
MKTINKISNLCIVLVFFGLNSVFGQASKVYVGITGLNSMQQQYIKANNIKSAIIFYQVDVAPGDGRNLNSDLFTKRINEKIPDANATGVGIVDWEVHANEVFTNNDDPVEHQRMVNEFIKTIAIAKKMRPNVKWGFYGMPIRTFDAPSSKWTSANRSLTPLFKIVDVLAPSLYIYNSDPQVYSLVAPKVERGRGDHLATNLQETLQIAKTLNKEVYPFIWQRINSGNKEIALQLVPLNTFKNYVSTILNSNYQGKKVSGVIWWDSQSYFYQTRAKFGGLANEYKSVRNVDQYNLDIFKKYYNCIDGGNAY